MDYIYKILRTICFYIDNVVFEGIGHVYDLLLKIARTSIFNANTIEGFYEKVYALIGIFMLFKISFSLISYILNPDEFSDKDKGFAAIGKRVILSLLMLVLVPYGFQEAYEVQTIILEDNAIAAIVFDDIDNNENAIYQIDTAGDKMKYILMYTFFQPNYSGLSELDSNDYLASCAITYDRTDDGSVNIESDTGIFILNPDCFGTLSSDDKYPVDGDVYGKFWGSEYADKEDLYQTYAHGIQRQNFYLLFKLDIALAQTAEKNGVYLVNYMAPLSTVVGIAVLWILLMFCIDIAVRSVKLGFYELIAPIPILSYIDPKTKDGMLSKWFKQVSTTYLSLFMRLFAIYLAIFIINSVFQNGIADVVTGERIHDWWVLIFIVVGTLMFAKQLPKILEDTLGIKGSGDFTLNPMKKIFDEKNGMLGGKAIKRTAAIAGGVGTAALVGGAGLVTGQGLRFGAMGKAVAGGFKGEKFGKNFASSYGAGRARKKQLDQMKADGVSPWSVRGDKMYNAFHGESRSERIKHATEGMKAIQSQYESYEKTASGVDVYAKYADKQAKAAASRGDFVAQRAWEEARDNRVKEIHHDKGKVVTKGHVDDSSFFGRMDATTGTVDYKSARSSTQIDTSASAKTEINSALSNLSQSMSSLATSLNQKYGDVAGYKPVDATADPKGMKNAALGSQQSMETNAENIRIHDTAKYTGGSKK